MKWVVVSFDEDSKLYTVQNENGRTCRANADSVVYGVEGRKLKSIPRYTDEVLGEFSCNGMGVVIFETPEDFSTEGEVQHNCVNRYGYLDKMANGGTLICGVRKLDDIDTPFITCEVRLSNDGTAIGVAQFYRAFNERPSAPEESEFLREFAEFIHNHN